MWLGFLLVFILPILIPIVSGGLIFEGLEKSKRTIQWWKVIIGLIFLFPMIILEYVIGQVGDIAPLGGLIIGFFSAVIAIVGGVILIIILPKWRKIIGGVFCVIYTLGLCLSLYAGNAQSPENITEENGNQIILAIEKYYAQEAQYPDELEFLVPEYLNPLPEALTTQKTGWLYESTGSEFTLGYWKWPEKLGSWVCLYDSKNPEWECDLNNWGNFPVVCTPMPPDW